MKGALRPPADTMMKLGRRVPASKLSNETPASVLCLSLFALNYSASQLPEIAKPLPDSDCLLSQTVRLSSAALRRVVHVSRRGKSPKGC